MHKTTKAIISVAALLLIILVGGCTRNDGNIGKQFGQWKVTSITIDGEPDKSYQGNMFWSFQNSTVEMKYVEANHTTTTTFGNYRIMDETLFISFPDEARPPLAVPGLKVENEIQIVRLTGSRMTLAYNADPEDVNQGTAATVVLELQKW